MHRSSFAGAADWALAALIGLAITTGAVGSALAALPKCPTASRSGLWLPYRPCSTRARSRRPPTGRCSWAKTRWTRSDRRTSRSTGSCCFATGKDPVVFADKLNAIFGMVWHDGALYVMNMPHLTVLRDRDGDGKAEERKELFTDLGVPAGSPNDFNDHIVSGLKIGIDRYLYISVGDKGVPKATGPDGRTAQVVGGGVLRCRLDGTGLEVFSTGTRNHLEPNLDDRDNFFTYDNTDDGLGWWTRVTHHIDGGYYGYPFDYHTRTDRMLPRMAEYGGGSPCGDCFMARTRGPKNIAASSSGPSGASALSVRSDSNRRVRRSRSPRRSTLSSTAKSTISGRSTWRCRTMARPCISPTGRSGSWTNKTEKLGRVYAVTHEGQTGANTAARQRLRPDRGPDPAARTSAFNERFRAQTALTRQG